MAKTKIEYKQFGTAEEYRQYKESLVSELNTAVVAFNAATDVAERDKISDTIDELKKRIMDAARCESMMECLAADNPVLEACKRRFYTVSTTKEKDHRLEVIQKDKIIDLTTYNSCVFAWMPFAELFCKVMTKGLASALESDTAKVIDKFKLSDDAVKLAKEQPDLCKVSTTMVKKYLQTIMPMMIGTEFNVRTADARYLQEAFTKMKGTELQCLTPRGVVCALTNIGYHIVTGTPYDLIQKAIKIKDA